MALSAFSRDRWTESAATADLDGSWSSTVLDARALFGKLFYFRSTANVALTVKLMSLSSATAMDARQINGDISLADGSVTATTDEVYVSDYHPFMRVDVTSGGPAASGALAIIVTARKDD